MVVPVDDLDGASRAWREAGFTLKEGRLHPNGLRNRHVKLADGSSVELMAVVGEPTDALALGYRRFLQDGEGGAFLALGAPAESVATAATRVGIPVERSGGGPFRYVVPSGSGRDAVFFIEYATPVVDPDSLTTHANGSTGTAEVVVEADAGLVSLLEALGGVPCEDELAPMSRGRRIAVADGVVTVVPAPEGARPRVRVVRLRRAGERPRAAFLRLNGVDVVWPES
ncbi:MAG: VOC family protein [Gemmatimonadota bacterium]